MAIEGNMNSELKVIYEKLISNKLSPDDKIKIIITLTDEEYDGWRWYLIRKKRKQLKKG